MIATLEEYDRRSAYALAVQLPFASDLICTCEISEQTWVWTIYLKKAVSVDWCWHCGKTIVARKRVAP